MTHSHECAFKRGRQFTNTRAMTVLMGELEIDAEVEYSISKFVPAKLTADPCYSTPQEGGDVEILKVTHTINDIETGGVLHEVDLFPILPKGEEERLRTVIFENETA